MMCLLLLVLKCCASTQSISSEGSANVLIKCKIWAGTLQRVFPTIMLYGSILL